MNLLWGLLIILGGVCWEPAHCFRLQSQIQTGKGVHDLCLIWGERSPIYGPPLFMTDCQEKGSLGSDMQTWLWEGKAMKNKKSGKCLGVETLQHGFLLNCSYIGWQTEFSLSKERYMAMIEFSRVGEHGLKSSLDGKCLKIHERAISFQTCKEGKDDPFYE
jgi:hypothetical protein